MAVAKVKKINIIAHNSYKKEILELLYDKGFIEIITPKKDTLSGQVNPIVSPLSEQDGPEDNMNTEYELAKVKNAFEFLNSYYREKKTLIEKINCQKIRICFSEIDKLRIEFDYIKVSETAETLLQGLNNLKSLIIKLAEEKKILLPWKNLGLCTGTDIETKTTKTAIGTIDKKKYDITRAIILDKYKEVEFRTIRVDDTEAFFYIIYKKSAEKEILTLLAAEDFKIIELPPLNITPEERILDISKELKKTRRKIIDIEKKAIALAKDNIMNFRLIFDFLSWKRDKEDVQKKFNFTRASFSILGWIRNSEIKVFEKELNNITETADISEQRIEAEDEVPIIMENSGLIKPFEFVTNIYGFPRHSEVDPTPFLAGFFIIFFGLCLTDAGYGLALGVTSFLALKFLKLDKSFTKLLKVLFVGSIITIIAGGLTGGWFGIVLEDLAAGSIWGLLAKPLIAIRQIDPVKDPITMLIFSLILGYIHLLFGNAINLWWKIKHGETREGLINSGVWIYFLLTIGFWLVASRGIAFDVMSGVAKYFVFSAIILVIATQGKSKNPFMKILGGLAKLYFGVTGYISDILSYSRLLALGLATGIIGMVINIVGAMANDMIPYVGWIIMILILIGGHLLNLVISLVGAFIHSGRLQYVEFFKTFFDGGGREFRPFIREAKYVNLIKK